MQVHGSCHCGSVKYEAIVDPERTTICHCTDCQSLTGSAFRVSVPAIEGSLRLACGKPTVYVKLGESGSRRAQAFCANCGSRSTPTMQTIPKHMGCELVALKSAQNLSRRRKSGFAPLKVDAKPFGCTETRDRMNGRLTQSSSGHAGNGFDRMLGTRSWRRPVDLSC